MLLRYPVTGCLAPFIKNPLPQQRASFRDGYPAAGLHATVIIIIIIDFASGIFVEKSTEESGSSRS
jgi:hypothetical protein